MGTNDYSTDPAVFSSEFEPHTHEEPAKPKLLTVGFRVSERDFFAYQNVADMLFTDGQISEPRVGAMLQYATNVFLIHYGEESDRRTLELRRKKLREQGIGDIYDPFVPTKSKTAGPDTGDI